MKFFFFIFVWLCCSQMSMNGFAEDWQRVYLATYPRSGNHWTRFLLEEATNIATSSVYRDIDPGWRYPHLPKIFPWGGYCCEHGYEGNRRYPKKDDIVVIKTHFPAAPKSHLDLAPHLRVIRIIRHPVDTCYSHFAYGNNDLSETVPHDFVVRFIANWRRFQKYYNQVPNAITFFYENLLSQPYATFSKLIEAVGYNVQYQDIERAIARYPPKGFELKHKNKFRREDLILIAYELSDLMQLYGYHIPID